MVELIDFKSKSKAIFPIKSEDLSKRFILTVMDFFFDLVVPFTSLIAEM